MDGGKTQSPLQSQISHHRHHHHRHQHHHHHHFFYISPNCPLHNSILQPGNHSTSCSFSTPYPSLQNPEPVDSTETNDETLITPDETDKLEFDEVEEEPIFVLTDEWRDLFAKSEAKRKQARKQAKKGKK